MGCGRHLENLSFTCLLKRLIMECIALSLIIAYLKHVSAIDKIKGQWVPYSRAKSPLTLMSSHHWTHTINFAFKGYILLKLYKKNRL